MLKKLLGVYSDLKILAILSLGFASGVPLALTASTLGMRLAESGVSNTDIGLFAAVAVPYALKFLWSPLMDAVAFPVLCRWFGQRRGWLIGCEMLLMAGILLLGLADPAHNPWPTALLALMVATFSASQDIVIDAYRVEILKPEEYGAGAAAVVLGYRLGMITSSAGALLLATRLGWPMTYAVMAVLVGVGAATVLLVGEPQIARDTSRDVSLLGWLRHHVWAPFADFMARDYWLATLLLVLLYKLGDAFMGVMTNPFLHDIGFTRDQVATIVKLYGVAATICGSFIGGALVFRLGTGRTLWLVGIAHALTNLLFAALVTRGADTAFLALSISLENVTGGMAASAFVACLSGLCNLRFTATQYALLSSFAAFGRTLLSTPAGWCAEMLGWQGFFILSTSLAIPSLVLLRQLMQKIDLERKA